MLDCKSISSLMVKFERIVRLICLSISIIKIVLLAFGFIMKDEKQMTKSYKYDYLLNSLFGFLDLK